MHLDGALPLVTLPGPSSSALRPSLSGQEHGLQPGPVSGSALMQVPQLSRGPRCQPQQMTLEMELAFQEQRVTFEDAQKRMGKVHLQGRGIPVLASGYGLA